LSKLVNYHGQKIDLEAQLEELRRAKYEDSLYEFLKAGWKYIDPAPFKDGWVLGALAEHLEAVVDGQIRRLMIHIPPRCSKSSICSVAFPAWVWAQPIDSPTSGPGVPIVGGSYAFKLSVRDSGKCRRLIKSPWYQKYWGQRVVITPDNDQKLRFSNVAGGERLVTSVDGGVTGEGGNIIIIDDANNAKEVLSEAIIEKTNEDWWDGTMSTRLNDPKTGAFIVIQQRLGENDLSGHIQRKEDWPDWCHLMLPMEYERDRAAMIYPNIIGWSDPREEEGELLWPARFGHKEVTTLKSNLGSWRAAGQLQQRPEPQGGGIIKRDHWQLWPPEGEATDDLGNIIKPAAFPPMDYILASLDTAYTLDNMNDPSALTVWGVFSGDVIARDLKVSDTMTQRVYGTPAARVMLMYAWTGREELHGLVNRVNRICGRGPGGMRVDKLLIENKGPGISVAQELRRLFANGGYAVQLNDPGRTDKVARLYSVQNIFEELAVFAPERSWSEAVMHQCGSFPNGDHDDLVDTVSQALRHLRDIGLLSRAEERFAELDDRLNNGIGRALPPLYPG
jgi:predicted phage terminase large subunit-like protein